ncbi:peptidyl-prolyl cis-trans isomerase CYP28, chloroplastic [Vigna unguiculata]|uniref:Peptidyl-prolyl cis-trans isomerase n=1 Tax=Vigna unguiculata TaxID=3917 RepID=A0A4D6NJ45_VIGUN|nr:peptidyl-prolyl cis-trans isomerase CYP28, chloroplastic [Vigna unguiculata]QCE13800.1 peptidyl-prolyl cis-trans isomerase D [Vigna unguiculata]
MAYSLPPPPPPPPSLPLHNHFTRRSLLLLSTTTTTTTTLSLPSTPPPTPTVTDRVFMDFSLCPNNFLPDRPDSLSPICSDSTLLGRVVLGLFGNLVPLTVSNFKSVCLGSNATSSSYKNTLVHKVFPGQYLLAGRQGRPDKGEVRPPRDLPRNTETVDAKAFALTHSRPGVVSLSLSENDDDDDIKLDPEYRNVEFLITTGPGPCPQLDNKNIVFGTVLEGLDVITAIASIPTYQPSERIRQFNDLAEFFGDGRAQNARNIWNRPLTTVYISDCGELKVTKPSLTPSLP